MIIIGLTGSIGMGKSTTADMFRDEGIPVWDADAAVHRLYGKDGAAVPLFAAQFPEAVIDGTVSRDALKQVIQSNPDALKAVEQIVHPLVADDRAAFIAKTDADICVLDIPLLFENGGQSEMDAVVCVTVDAQTQQARVMERGTMTYEQFQTILAKQMDNAKKCALSDYVIETDTIEHARQQVHAVVSNIRKI